MAKKVANALNIDDLNLSDQLLKKAQLFANYMGYGTNHPFYYFVIKWYKDNVKSNGEVLEQDELEKFYKDVDDENYDGPIHRKINEEIGKLVDSFEPPSRSAPSVDKKQRVRNAAATAKEKQEAKKRGRPPGQKTPKPPRPLPPKIELWINNNQGERVVEIVKGQTYTVNWKSENAVEVTNSQQFPSPILDSELNGSRTITATRLSNKTFSITVSNQTGNTKKGIVKVIVVRATDQSQPTPTPTPRRRQQTPTPRTQTTRVTRSFGPSSGMAGADPVLLSISKSVNNIAKILEKQSKFLTGVRKAQRRRLEDERRTKREGALEEVKGGIKGVLESVFTPLKNVFDRIWKFIFFTLLGRAFAEFMNWFNDPKNKEKVKTLTRFLKDFFPLIAGAALYFLTPFGGFVNSTIRLLMGFSRLLMAHPVIATAVALGAASVFLTQQGQKAQDSLIDKAAKERAKKEGKSVDEVKKELKRVIKPFGESNSIFQTNPSAIFASGGEIFSGTVTNKTGRTVRGAGKDTQLLPVEGGGNVVLQKGETVLQKGVREKMVSTLGIDPLMFNKGPNANKPKTINGKRLMGMKDGGVVGDANPKMMGLLNSSAKAIFDRLVKGGLTPTAAAGIVANIGVESAYTYDPGIHQREGGPGRGLVQWEKGGRFDTDNINLKDFAKSRKKPWNDLNTQVDFILHELNTHPEYMAVKKKLNSAKSLSSAVSIFLKEYEKAGVPHIEDRLKVGNDIIKSGWLSPVAKSNTKPKPQAESPNIIQQLLLGFPKGAEAKEKDRSKKTRSWWDIRNLFGMKRGGMVIDSSLKSIKGEMIDKYPILAQAGEYVVPKLTVQRIGAEFFDTLVANTDKNSKAAKLGAIPRRDVFEPPSVTTPSMNQVMTLPPIVQGMGNPIKNTGSSEIPSFPAISPLSSEARSMFVELYGIIV